MSYTRRFGIKPVMAGNTGVQMGGWYKKPLQNLDDLRGLKIRMPGLGGEVMRRLGAAPVGLPPGELFQALQTGVLDATEFLGPWSDRAMGFQKAAKYYYSPGFHEPNGTGEALFNQAAFDALPTEFQAIYWRRAALRMDGRLPRAIGKMPEACSCSSKKMALRSFPIQKTFLKPCAKRLAKCCWTRPVRIR
jgi:TRAP-type mannitol/chloroaromatic compound transport system substrate-binding protein